MSSSSKPFSGPRDICLENNVLSIPFKRLKHMCHVRWYFRWKNVIIFQRVQKLVSCLSSKDVIYKQSWLCCKPQLFSFGLYIRQNDFFKELQRLRLVAVVLQISAQGKSIWKLNFWETLTRILLVYQLHWDKCIFHSDRKSGSGGSFAICFRDWNVFCPFLFHFIWRNLDVFWRCLIEIEN